MVPAPDVPNELREFQRLLRIHACRRLIEAEQPRFRGESPRDLDPSLQPVRKRSGLMVRDRVKTLLLQQIPCLLFHPLLFPMIKEERRREGILLRPHMLRHEHIVKDGLFPEQANVLKRPRDARLCDLVRGVAYAARVFSLILTGVQLRHPASRHAFHDHLPLKGNPPVGRLVHPGDAVERRRLPRSVGADQRRDLAFADPKRKIVHRHDAAELHRDIFQKQNRPVPFSAHCPTPS